MTDPATRARPNDARAEGAARPVDVVFVGGTGRSGTHVLAKLLGRHSRFEKVGNEVRFHCDPGGFPDLLDGRATLDEFLERLRGPWWRRVQTLQVRGLHRTVPPERFETAVARFEASFEDDPVAACRALFLDLLAPLAEEAEKPGLVEMSCDNVAQGPALLRIFPETRFVHSLRDGRDAASSRVAKGKGLVYPRSPVQGLEWWEGRLRRIDAAVRHMPPDRVVAVSLDELVYGDREATYRRLLDFLGLEDEVRMRSFFESRMSAASAHRDRWRQGLSERQQGGLGRGYEEALERLERDGVHCAELLRRSHERRAPTVSSPAMARVPIPPRSPSEEPAGAAAAGKEDALGEIVFVGGTAPWGARAVTRVLGASSGLCALPIKASFHCDPGGVCDLLEGRVSLYTFLLRLRGVWWDRERGGRQRGLRRLVPEERFEAALERFEASYHPDPVLACRRLFGDLLWPAVADAGKSGLVEQSPNNLGRAPALFRLFPEARFVHVVRDGRAAAVRARKGRGPKDPLKAIDWWARRLRQVDAAVRGEEDGASYSLSPRQLHVVVLDELAEGDRAGAYGALLDFVGLEDEPEIGAMLERQAGKTGPRANGDGLPPLKRRRLARKYERTLERLDQEGVHCAPELIAAYERT